MLCKPCLKDYQDSWVGAASKGNAVCTRISNTQEGTIFFDPTVEASSIFYLYVSYDKTSKNGRKTKKENVPYPFAASYCCKCGVKLC